VIKNLLIIDVLIVVSILRQKSKINLYFAAMNVVKNIHPAIYALDTLMRR